MPLGKDSKNHFIGSRLHYLYFILAAIDILTVSGSLLLNHRVLQYFQSSVVQNQAWVDRLEDFDELTTLAALVNAPGNDVFDSHDWKGESEKLETANLGFLAKWNAVKNVSQSLEEAPKSAILEKLDAVRLANEKMVEEAVQIFSYFKKEDHRLAGSRMATMDRKFAALNRTLSELRKMARDFSKEELQNQNSAAQNLSKYEILIALIISIMVVGVLIYGHRLSKQLRDNHTTIIAQQQSLIQTARLASLGEMAAGIAHEINNPLSVIRGRSEQLLEYSQKKILDENKLGKTATQIAQMSGRISQIVRSLKSYARNGEADPFSSITVGELLNDVLSLSESRMKAHGIDFNVDTKDLAKMVLDCRPSEISQVLINLLNNALDAVEPQPEKVISLKMSLKTPEQLEIQVSDNGPGMTQAIAQKIMDPFYTTKEPGKGTGLGLSLSKGIIDSHGGQIEVASLREPTTFVIRLPINQTQKSPSEKKTGTN